MFVIVIFIPWDYINMPKEKKKQINALLKEISKLFFLLLSRNIFSKVTVDLTNPPKFSEQFKLITPKFGSPYKCLPALFQ